MNEPSTKFRPVLTESNIKHILNLARTNMCAASEELIRALSLFEYKIQNDLVNPAYTETPRESLGQSLGFESHENTADPHTLIEALTSAQELLNDGVLYDKWMQNPRALTLKQLQRVRAYRYDQNKMTVEEEALFEKEVLGMDFDSDLNKVSRGI